VNLRLSEEARDDLRAIYSYLSERSPQAADSVVGTILKAANGLTVFPLMGRQGEVAGTRGRVVARYPYIIVYVLEEDTVVARILHVAQQRDAQIRAW